MSLAFAIVSIFIAKLLFQTSKVISTLSHTVAAVETKTDIAITELEGTLTATELTAIDIQTKLQAADGLFLATRDIGDTSKIISGDLLLRTKNFNSAPNLPGTKPFVRTIQLAEFSFKMFNSWKRGQNASS